MHAGLGPQGAWLTLTNGEGCYLSQSGRLSSATSPTDAVPDVKRGGAEVISGVFEEILGKTLGHCCSCLCVRRAESREAPELVSRAPRLMAVARKALVEREPGPLPHTRLSALRPLALFLPPSAPSLR